MPTAQDDISNELFWELFNSDDPRMQKSAENALNDYTRLKIRDDGVTDRILTPLPIGDSDLDRQWDTALPAKVVDMEPNSPAAVTVPLQSFPNQIFIKGPRYRVTFSRTLSPWFQADVETLRTYVMDIRQILSDNAMKDMRMERDSRLFGSVDSILIGADQVSPFSGVVQWRTIHGPITRNSLEDSKKMMMQTPSHLAPVKMVTNMVTKVDLEKFTRDEAGGDYSQDLFREGITDQRFNKLDLVVTINRNVIPDGTIYYFADERFLGKLYELEPITLYTERKAFLLSYFMYWCYGMTIANPNGLSRVDYRP